MSQRPGLPDQIGATRVIAIARGIPAARLPAVAAALQEAGVGALEVTLDRGDALQAVASLTADDRLTLAIGCGTVLEIPQAERALDAGATYLVCPHVDEALVRWACDRGVPILPGAMTPTEVLRAWRAGAAAVKLFPAEGLGPGYVQALGGPLAGIPLVPTGGVTAANARAFLEAGAVAVGVGGWLLGDGSPDRITARAHGLLAAIRQPSP